MSECRDLILLVLLLSLFRPGSLSADASLQQLEATVAEQAQRIEQLEAVLRKLGVELDAPPESSREQEPKEGKYDRGFVVTDVAAQDEAYALTVNGRMQFRYNGFSPRRDRYTFDDGTTGIQEQRNDFEIERGRLEFSGHIGKPELRFYLNLDFDTDDNHEVIAHDFWFDYEFDEALRLYFGKAFVPGSREWINGSTTTHLIDRSLATSFFRPDRSLGIWGTGEVNDLFSYRVMLANGFSTTDLKRDEVDDTFTSSGTVWSDLIGSYGKGAADLEWHEALALRVGASFTYSPVTEPDGGEPIGEADAVRLSNGVRLSSTGALQEGVTVSAYDISLTAVDLALKYRGWGFNTEAYYRELSGITAQGGAAFADITDKGMTADLGYFVVPKLLEVVVRYSAIDGAVANSSEYAFGVNYFLNGTHKNKFSIDIAQLEDAAVRSSGPNYEVGATGWLYRAQWQIGF
ncbi:OprO/OprP family phosphate-selective porin [bacterium]|nr:OprO/OprP family phosphate-selective porin [bacterium]